MNHSFFLYDLNPKENMSITELPNLAGVATKDLVEQIGTGSFKASYINWSRTLHLLRQHAPGWTAECVPNYSEGGLLHRAPVGAYLLIRFRHISGTTTPEVPQAVMDHRNSAIPYDKITARDITDTQRRGTCMAAAFVFGLAYELWAKMPLESGYRQESEGPELPAETSANTTSGTTEAKFVAAAKKAGLTELAIDLVKGKLNGDWAAGIKTLAAKTADEIAALNAAAG
jgi:hypothetical protein